jgi:hypothetical protein
MSKYLYLRVGFDNQIALRIISESKTLWTTVASFSQGVVSYNPEERKKNIVKWRKDGKIRVGDKQPSEFRIKGLLDNIDNFDGIIYD